MRRMVLFAITCLAVVPARAQWFVEGETGMVWSGYNDVRIPGDTGTGFSLTEDLETDPGLFFRLRLGRTIGGRHHLSVFAAPLRLEASGEAGTDISFNGVTFPAGTDLDASYRFDSYRLTWRYDLLRGDDLTAALGLTAKIRDASIGVSGGGQETVKKNTGFVPLLSFALDWRVSGPLHLLLDGDALAGPQGRAEDVFAGAGWAFDDRNTLLLGYRIVEGGADVEEVYNFTLANFASLGYRLVL